VLVAVLAAAAFLSLATIPSTPREPLQHTRNVTFVAIVALA